MKQIKWLVIMLLLVMVVSCTNYKDISFDGVIELCADKSDGDLSIFTECLRNQSEAAGKLIDYLDITSDVNGYQDCLKKNTDDLDRSDLVKVGMCLGLGASDNTI